MRASTLFAVTVALLVGLGLAATAKMFGLLNRSAVVVKKPEIQVLVTARNVFAGDVIEQPWVRVRPLKPEEVTHYEQNKDQYLPAVPGAAVMRIATRNLEADQPLLRNQLQALAKPDPLHQRLVPGARAVSLSIPKDRCAGGQIQVGEWVDVHLTTTIQAPDGQSTTRTAPIASKLRVIVKRHNLWKVFGPLPDDKPVHYMLEANPYRAALIEFAKSKGNLTLVPVSAAEQKSLEDQREKRLVTAPEAEVLQPVAFFADADNEFSDDARVTALNRGELTVGNHDLMRIFALQPNTPPPPLAEVRVEQLAGISRVGTATFDANGNPVSTASSKRTAAPAARNATPTTSFQFASPEDCTSCKTCGKNKKK